MVPSSPRCASPSWNPSWAIATRRAIFPRSRAVYTSAIASASWWTRATPRSPSSPSARALPSTDNPEELYRNSYEFILSGDYKTAEAGFRDHIDRFPNDPMAADAHFWLGEAVLSQQNYAGAAEIFLDGSKTYPDSKKAPDMLLKLGVSLVGLKQREVACATFAEVAKRYPDSSDALKERVKAEQALAAC